MQHDTWCEGPDFEHATWTGRVAVAVIVCILNTMGTFFKKKKRRYGFTRTPNAVDHELITSINLLC